jgi:hypothetical protein
MAYISKEQVKETRDKLKTLKGCKFSVTRTHYSSINVSILTALIELRNNIERDCEQVNQYHIDSRDNKDSIEFLNTVHDIVNEGNYNNSDAQSDYFDVGFYVNISIGMWNKPFRVITL